MTLHTAHLKNRCCKSSTWGQKRRRIVHANTRASAPEPPVTYFDCSTGCFVHVGVCFDLASDNVEDLHPSAARLRLAVSGVWQGVSMSPDNSNFKKKLWKCNGRCTGGGSGVVQILIFYLWYQILLLSPFLFFSPRAVALSRSSLVSCHSLCLLQ